MKLQSVIVVVCVVLFSSLAFGTRPDTSYRESPLHFAAYRGDLSAVKALVKGGADINEIGKISGYTPLHWAVNFARLTLVSLSPSAGIPKFPKQDSKRYVYYFVEIVRVLVENGADVNIKDRSGETVLYQAVSKGKTAMAEIFIRQGRANVNVKNKWGNTPLHVARDPKTAKFLVSAEADVHARNKQGNTPLHRAKSFEIRKLLIETGADVNARNTSGATPLHYMDDVPSAKLLVATGADINARDNEGKTPLHNAGRLNILAMLVKAGADKNIKDNEGEIPMDYASTDEMRNILKP